MPRLLTRKWWADRIANWIEQIREGDVELFLQIFREYFHRFWKRYVLIFMLIGIASAATAVTAWLVKDVVNEVFVDRNAEMLIPLVLMVLAIFTARGFSIFLQMVLSQRISNAMVADIQKRLIRHVLTQRLDFFSQNGSDTLLMRFNQGAQAFNQILNLVLVNGLRDFATLIGLIIVMLIQDPILALVSFTVAPAAFYGVSVLLKKMKDISKEELAGFADLNRLVRETVQGISIVKAYNLEGAQRNSSANVIEGIRQRRDRMAALQAAPSPLLDTVTGTAVSLAILYAGFRMMSDSYDAGTFMSFLTALLMATDPARKLSQMRVKLRRSFMAVQMVFDLLNKDQSEANGTKLLPGPLMEEGAAETPAIAFQSVNFSYNNKTPVLKGLDLEVAPGEMVALVGPSGAGKSTLFKLLLKFHAPDAGRVELFGNDVAELDNAALRGAISFVGQSNFIFAGSIRDNLSLRNHAVSQDQIEAACRAVGLHDDIAALPKGYDTDVGELGTLISGGQAQRLNMARAIIKDAPILLLDEVTSALDAENEQLIKDYIRAQAQHKTVLVIAHRLSTVKEADRIALVQDGRIAAQGRHDELAATNSYYEKIVALQFAA
ncbi:ABC transporter ATP-binding protein [Dichotomicrobium thermohalophilum]|uniref:ATP-binding cassette subfamily B protein n=1 Tax=Dichotomicrobium thermohalophilum TaxID=933063 RepID=A0A397Q4K7_9HYPH|nr:ABC transporter ATP-binding protein [Dichotomicrobium thermohalophilum]RIA56042.1 ATP-binding cassette subfamily B protein [Dichotomicrobium thermohalophilum]